jgi:hypothetical protein
MVRREPSYLMSTYPCRSIASVENPHADPQGEWNAARQSTCQSTISEHIGNSLVVTYRDAASCSTLYSKLCPLRTYPPAAWVSDSARLYNERKPTFSKCVTSFESTHRLMLCTRRTSKGSIASTIGTAHTADPGVDTVHRRQVWSNLNR